MEQLDLDNKEWQDALQIVDFTRRSLFLTGKAGTGKSTFLRYVDKHTKKKHVILAPTGIAAINAGGATLHSFFRAGRISVTVMISLRRYRACCHRRHHRTLQQTSDLG